MMDFESWKKLDVESTWRLYLSMREAYKEFNEDMHDQLERIIGQTDLQHTILKVIESEE